MTNFKNIKKAKIAVFILVFSMLATAFAFSVGVNPALAAVNLIKGGNFEGDVSEYWGTWQREDSARTYEFYRAYDAPFGYGSYCAAIDAQGTPEEAFSAVLSSNSENNIFQVDAAKNYYLLFYAKATQNLDIIAYLQRADNYNALTNYHARTITQDWQRYIINLAPTATSQALLGIVYGNMPDGASLYLDGIQLVETNLTLGTSEVKGYIGDQNKSIKISNINTFSENDIEIELPYYDNLTSQITTTRLNPKKMSASGVYFDMPERTFAGVGRVYVSGNYIGQFNYNVLTRISGFYPSLIRVDEDLVVTGTGFIPTENSTFLIVSSVNSEGQSEKMWIAPNSIDSNLSQMSFVFPAGVVSGKMYAQISFLNMDNEEKINKSNSLSYKLKPIIYATNWSMRGYEHVGDKLMIYGKGMGRKPYVNFYDNEGNKVDSKRSKLIEVTDMELVEVDTTKKTNDFNITVVSDGVESDQSSSLNYLAKPRFKFVKTKYSRVMYGSNEKIQAAKISDEITLTGEGFKPNPGSVVVVEFQGLSLRIQVNVAEENINSNGTSLKVIVPQGAQNGYVNIQANGQTSNYLPIEIIPTVASVSPDPVVPGNDIIISANGVGNNLNLIKVYFKLDKNSETTVQSHAVDFNGDQALVYVRAPLAMSNNSSSVSLQYDKWRDNGSSVLNVYPTITNASINMDDKILSIKGYGFSISPKENIITYMYADQGHTVITPKVKVLGVYPTEEGQEIRVRILDDYHYGYVTVRVGDNISDEANFGPVSVSHIARRIEYVAANDRIMGVLYISGYNFGSGGGVLVGEHWAEIHYRSDFFIIAVIDQQYLYDNPVIVARD